MLWEDRVKMAVGKGLSGKIYDVAGVRLSAVSAGIRYQDRLDLVLIELTEESKSAGVFTQNVFCAAPVVVAKSHLSSNDPRVLIINTGNANAGTGDSGLQDALQCCQIVAECTGLDIQEVIPFSTGVIGEKLPVKKITAGVPRALDRLDGKNWKDAAIGILTTDTRPKLLSKQVKLADSLVTITGFAKGSGMIRPNMATMLSFVFTDALIEKELLDEMISELVDESFNRITVDGDTSTNDAAMLVATGKSGVPIAELDDTNKRKFDICLKSVFQQLAKELIKDAEGATKFITVVVKEGRDKEECAKVAFCVAESLLVKTALFASDANWGRILAAIGRAGLDKLDTYNVNIDIGDVRIVTKGNLEETYTEEKGKSVMELDELIISIELGRGNIEEAVWTSDLSHDYVTINADYRT